MPKPRVYVETTIPNFYYDFRPSEAVALRREATRRWWATAAEQYELVTSSIVHDELARGTTHHVLARLQLLAGLESIPLSAEVAHLVAAYLRHKLVPAKPPEDAMHLALASLDACDLIVSWNCRHLANPNKAVHIQRINTRLGLPVPRLLTPLDLLGSEP